MQPAHYFIAIILLPQGGFQHLWEELPNQQKSSSINWVEEMLEEGFRRGHEKGIEKGIEEGLEKAQKSMKQEIITRGYEQGFSMEQLGALTGYSVAEIEQLIQKN